MAHRAPGRGLAPHNNKAASLGAAPGLCQRPLCSIDPPEKGLHMADHILESEAQAFADATSQPPFLYEIGPDAARKVLDDVQAAPIDEADVGEDKWITVSAPVGDVQVRLVKPV